MLMHTNNTNKNTKLIYPELSYIITGICFEVHNNLGRFCREKQICDAIENKLIILKLLYKREFQVAKTGNIADFLVADKIILEIKTKPAILKEDYFQTQRYLQAANIKLGLLVNFRSRYLKPIRVVKIETSAKQKFLY